MLGTNLILLYTFHLNFKFSVFNEKKAVAIFSSGHCLEQFKEHVIFQAYILIVVDNGLGELVQQEG